MAKPDSPTTKFISAHLQLTNKEIRQKAAGVGIELNLKQISNTRNRLKRRGAETKPARARAPATSNGHADMSPKETQLRKLIFELGFDAARNVFREFEDMHSRMKGS